MDPQSWQRVKEIFLDAVEREPAVRAGFLREACAGDAGLLAEVQSLLSADEGAGDFIDDPAFASADAAWPEADSSPAAVGQRVGAYEVVRELGRGGMGAVYLAERADSQFDKQVAIKIVKRGMDTEFVLRRFSRERQVLAGLDHPNIAKLLDGGATEDGLPYFVMEYVEGEPVTDYCDRHRLSVTGRLKLFRDVCSAVQYAHQNLVVHRDLKPSNILVTAEGTPKLLDFGIAKLLNPTLAAQTIDQTGTWMRLMTPEYASPEQVQGLQITTASDVYSLGVLLYELLTGHRPYRLRSRAPAEVARAVCEDEPERPSTAISRVEDAPATDGAEAPVTRTPETVATTRDTQPERLRRRLSGDLDNIILKAMRKEPPRRYASVEQLSEDIRRHLEGLPVTAQRDTFTYRSSKFIRRHRAGVAAATLVVVTLIVGVVATAWQAHLARVERARAERRFNDVRRLANSFMFEFHDSIANLEGATPARKLVVTRALEYLDGLAQEESGDVSLQRELATAYVKVGDVQGYPLFSNIGDPAGALESYRKALTIREGLAAAHPENVELRRELAASYGRVGSLLPVGEGLQMYRKSLAIREALVTADPTNAQLQRDLARNDENVAQSLGSPYDENIGDTKGALEYYQKALAIRQELFARDPTMEGLRSELFDSYHLVADILFEIGRFDEALQYQRQAQPVLEEVIAADPSNAEAQRNLAVGEGRICKTLETLGRFNEALEICEKSFATNLRLSAGDPQNAFVRRQQVSGYNQIGMLLLKTGDVARAIEYHRRALRVSLELLALDPTYADTRTRLANSYEGLANALALSGSLDEAAQICRKALDIRKELSAARPEDARLQRQLATNHVSLGAIMLKTENAAEALRHYREALTIREPLAATDSLNYMTRHDLAEVYFKMGEAYARLASKAKNAMLDQAEDWREARSWYARSMEIYQDLYSRNQLPAQYVHEIDDIKRGLAKCEAALGRGK